VIGWLERTLIVAGLAAGRPELLAVVVAVKSVARLPEFKNETFAEYFLIGSLLSLTGAVLAGGLVRLLVFGELP
jgi:F0F1-type ATP synthase membrane subunit c/vacuolar-type H+-ATPase subunit K